MGLIGIKLEKVFFYTRIRSPALGPYGPYAFLATDRIADLEKKIRFRF